MSNGIGTAVIGYGYWGVATQSMSLENGILAGGLCAVSGSIFAKMMVATFSKSSGSADASRNGFAEPFQNALDWIEKELTG